MAESKKKRDVLGAFAEGVAALPGGGIFIKPLQRLRDQRKSAETGAAIHAKLDLLIQHQTEASPELLAEIVGVELAELQERLRQSVAENRSVRSEGDIADSVVVTGDNSTVHFHQGHVDPPTDVLEVFVAALNQAISARPPTNIAVTEEWPVVINEMPQLTQFIGRVKLLEKLERQLREQPETVVANQQVVYGLGGVGKTQLVRKFVEDYRENYRVVWWVKAEQPAEIPRKFQQLAKKLEQYGLLNASEQQLDDLEVIVALVVEWLGRNGDWLLVFDNAVGARELMAFRPDGEHDGHVLITSRNPNFGSPEQRLHVERLGKKDAYQLLAKRAKRPQNAALKAVAEELGYLPLALAQAAAYVSARQTSFETYLELLKGSEDTILVTDELAEYGKSVIASLSLSFDYLRETSPAAWSWLCHLSFLDPDGVPLSLFTEQLDDWPESLRAEFAAQAKMLDLRGHLIRTSLATFAEKPDTVSVHRLTQAACRAALGEEGQRNAVAAVAAAINSAVTFDQNNHLSWQPAAGWLSQALACVPHADRLGSGREDIAKALNLIGRVHGHIGAFSVAREVQRKAVAIFEEIYSSNQPELAIVYSNLAGIEGHFRSVDKERELLQKAITILKQADDSYRPVLTIAYENLAVFERSLGNTNEALDLMKKAIAICERDPGSDDPHLAHRYVILAQLEKDSENLPVAQELLRKAIAIFRLAHDDLRLATAYSELCLVERELGNLSAARELIRKTIAINEQVYDVDHPTLGRDYGNMALVEMDLGNLSMARELTRKAIVIYEQAYPAEHPMLAIRYNSLAMVEMDLGNLLVARELMHKSIAINEQAFPSGHRELAANYSNLAMLEMCLGELLTARNLMRRAYRMMRSIAGLGHSHTQDVLGWLRHHDPEFREEFQEE